MLSMYVATKAALEAFAKVLSQEVVSDDIRVTTVIQGATREGGGGSADWEWHPDAAQAAVELWERLGLLNIAQGQRGGQGVDDIGEVHLFIVTRPRTQKMDTVFCRSF